MICSTCGKTNADHLTFCEDCGARLRARIVPPTPPVGLGVAPVPTPGEMRPVPQPGLVSSPVLPVAAPSAPQIPAAGPSAPQVPIAAPSAPAIAGSACPRCGAACAPNLRFCTSCGQPLDAAKPPPVASPSPIAMSPAPPPVVSPPPAPVAVAPIAPAPVVDLGARKEPEPTRTCPRCKAQSPATAQFCRYCGAGLGEATPLPIAPPAPVPPRPAVAQPQPAPAPIPAPAPPAPPQAPPPKPQEKFDQTVVSETPSFDGSKTTEVQAMAGPTAPRGRLVVIARDGGEGPSHPILDQLDIGRSEGDVIIADDRYLSPRHARIVRRGATVFVRDLWSVNGIYRRVRPHESGEQKLQDQDLILLGQQVLRFEIVKEGEEGFGPAVQHGTLVFGTPVGPRLARLVVRSTDGVARDVHHLRKSETVLGREQGDIVFTDDPFLSRRHAVLRVKNMGSPNPIYTLGDLESSNGTFLRIRGEVEVQHGDELRMGQQLFRLDLSGKEHAASVKGQAQPAAMEGG